MKLKVIVSKEFGESLKQMMSMPLPATTSFAIKKVGKLYEEQSNLFDATRADSLKKFANLNEDGSVKVNENDIVEFKDQESQSLFIKEINDLGEVEVEMPTVKLASLGDAKIEPRALLVLSDIIVE